MTHINGTPRKCKLFRFSTFYACDARPKERSRCDRYPNPVTHMIKCPHLVFQSNLLEANSQSVTLSLELRKTPMETGS